MRPIALLLLVLAGLALPGCSSGSARRPPRGVAVLIGGRVALRDSDVATLERGCRCNPRRRLGDVVRTLWIAAEARRRGLRVRAHGDGLAAALRAAVVIAPRVTDALAPPLRPPTADEVAAAYRATTQEYTTPARVSYLSVTAHVEADARRALAALRAGSDPAAVACHYGVVPAECMARGVVSGAELEAAAPELRTVLGALRAGDWFGPVEVAGGLWQVGRVLEQVPERVTPLSAVRERVAGRLEYQAFQERQKRVGAALEERWRAATVCDRPGVCG